MFTNLQFARNNALEEILLNQQMYILLATLCKSHMTEYSGFLSINYCVLCSSKISSHYTPSYVVSILMLCAIHYYHYFRVTFTILFLASSLYPHSLKVSSEIKFFFIVGTQITPLSSLTMASCKISRVLLILMMLQE